MEMMERHKWRSSAQVPEAKSNRTPEEEDNKRRKMCRLAGCKRARTEEFVGFCGRDCLESTMESKRLKQ